MAYKRTRKEFEADLRAQQSPYVVYGTPLPPFDPDVRDDGSYVPVWKQEVTDERGRKRLHGAFTGGFSAGYFNTVGSKDGWTPSSFVSSRKNRQKDVPQSEEERRAQYMDDEDLADAAEAQRVEISDAFSGLGNASQSSNQRGLWSDMLQTQGDTMGLKLLRKMGWKDGQGVGSKVRRKAQLGELSDETTLYTFAPDNTRMISFSRKSDRKGLGFQGGDSLREHSSLGKGNRGSEDEDDALVAAPTQARQTSSKRKQPRTGMGVGIFNDNDSDEEVYNMGPRISYTKVIGGDKKNKKKTAVSERVVPRAANPLLGARPVFRSKKLLETKTGTRRGHDGRLALPGFIFTETLDSSSSNMSNEDKYPLPDIPEGWTSIKTQPRPENTSSEYLSTADAAKASTLDAKARAELLGESLLPGKSVFDFVSPATRDRLAAATGRSNLPAGLGEMPAASTLPDQLDESMLPPLSKDVALAALGRGLGGWMPYADDEDKRTRYRMFMEYRGGLRQKMLDRPAEVGMESWLHELREFAHAAQVFRPMTGMMASRFTSASTLPGSTGTSSATEGPLLSTPATAAKPEDPAESAAKLGMYGPLTRSAYRFFPTRLVCKRFNVPPPLHAEEEHKADGTQDQAAGKASDLVTAAAMEQMRQEGVEHGTPPVENEAEAGATNADLRPGVVDASRNEALEAARAGEAVFRAIFGSDSESE